MLESFIVTLMRKTKKTIARSDVNLLKDARQIIKSEAQSLLTIAARMDQTLVRAIHLIHERTGPNSAGVLVVSGVGKSGLAGQRISASFASTGTPSHFLHPVEALHGDLGRVRRQDLTLLLSYGGETDELIRLMDHLKRLRVPTIAITSQASSSLGRLADICIGLGGLEEACPLRLAPTTSVTCISAVADAMVLGVMSLRHFSVEDFAAFHPAGSLGRKLLRVGDAMSFVVGKNISVAPMRSTVRQVLAQDKTLGRRAGAVILVNQKGALAGIFTDGDLRRKLGQYANLLEMPIAEVMTVHPKTIGHQALASEALALLNRHRIDELPVVDESNRPLGLIDVQDLVALRVLE